MFSAQAGARKVYAVEASAAADVAEAIIAHNGFSHVIQLVRGKLEEIELPEKVGSSTITLSGTYQHTP